MWATNTKDFIMTDVARSPFNDFTVRAFVKPDRTLWGRDTNGEFPLWGSTDWDVINYGTFAASLPYWGQNEINPAFRYPRANMKISNPKLFGSSSSSNLTTPFQKCFMTVREMIPWNQKIWSMQTFADRATLYTFLQANCTHSWGYYIYDIYIDVYDITDPKIKPITKINPINDVYSAMRDRQWYKSSTDPYLADEFNVWWTNYVSCLTDIMKTTYPSFTWNPWNDYNRLFWTSRKHRNIHRGLHEWASIRVGNRNRFCLREDGWIIDIAATPALQNKEFKVIHSESKYVVCWTWGSPFSYYLYDKGEYRAVKNAILWESDSVFIAYKLEYNDWVDRYRAWLIKPVSRDSIYIDYIDSDLYDVYMRVGDLQTYPLIHDIKLSSLQREVSAKATRLHKSNWMWLIKNWKTEQHVSFYKKDKTTWRISNLSSPTIRLLKGRRDHPYALEVFNK